MRSVLLVVAEILKQAAPFIVVIILGSRLSILHRGRNRGRLSAAFRFRLLLGCLLLALSEEVPRPPIGVGGFDRDPHASPAGGIVG